MLNYGNVFMHSLTYYSYFIVEGNLLSLFNYGNPFMHHEDCINYSCLTGSEPGIRSVM
jgi:hypothetical protein